MNAFLDKLTFFFKNFVIPEQVAQRATQVDLTTWHIPRFFKCIRHRNSKAHLLIKFKALEYFNIYRAQPNLRFRLPVLSPNMLLLHCDLSNRNYFDIFCIDFWSWTQLITLKISFLCLRITFKSSKQYLHFPINCYFRSDLRI